MALLTSQVTPPQGNSSAIIALSDFSMASIPGSLTNAAALWCCITGSSSIWAGAPRGGL